MVRRFRDDDDTAAYECEFCRRKFRTKRSITHHQQRNEFCRTCLQRNSSGENRVNKSSSRSSTEPRSAMPSLSGHFPITCNNLFFLPPTKAPAKDDISSNNDGDSSSEELDIDLDIPSDYSVDKDENDYFEMDFTREKAIIDLENNPEMRKVWAGQEDEIYMEFNENSPESVIYMNKQNTFFHKSFGENCFDSHTFEQLIQMMGQKPAGDDKGTL